MLVLGRLSPLCTTGGFSRFPSQRQPVPPPPRLTAPEPTSTGDKLFGSKVFLGPKFGSETVSQCHVVFFMGFRPKKLDKIDVEYVTKT